MIKKNIILPAYNRKLPSKRLSPFDDKAVSIINPRIRAADTSIIPVIIETSPDKDSTLKLPCKHHLKNLLRSLGGGPEACAVALIQFCGFMDKKTN